MLKVVSLLFIAALVGATAMPMRAGSVTHSQTWDAVEDDEPGEDEPSPTPEPGTLLTFASAFAAGGGVWMIGKLRKHLAQ
jgi:hypothetical protein